jgi:hypothetical protein
MINKKVSTSPLEYIPSAGTEREGVGGAVGETTDTDRCLVDSQEEKRQIKK